MKKRMILGALLFLAMSTNAYAFSLQNILSLLFSPRPSAPAALTVTAVTPTSVDLSWRAGDSSVGSYILLAFHDAPSYTVRFPKSCRFYLGSDHDVGNHDDDDENDAEDHRAFPRVDRINLGLVSSYRDTNVKPAETVLYRLCAVSPKSPKKVSQGAQILVNLPAADFAIGALARYSSINAPTLAWTVAAGAASYDLTIASDGPTCKTPVQSYKGLKVTSQKATALADNTYYICVRAKSAGGVVSNAANNGVAYTVDTTAPQVNAGANITASSPTMTAATAADKTELTYQWAKVSGPGALTFDQPTALNTKIAASANGAYVVKLTATDAAGNAGSASLNFTWAGANQISVAALADIMTNQAKTVTAVVTSTAAYTSAWTKTGGSGALTFSAPTNTTTAISANTDGDYQVTYTATDSSGKRAARSFSFSWDATAPGITLGSPIISRLPASLSAVASDAHPVTVSWSSIPAQNVTFSSPNTLQTTATATVDGVYTLKLTATDSFGNSSFKTVSYTRDATAPSLTVPSDKVVSVKTALSAVATDATAVAIQWRQVSGPGHLIFSAAGSASSDVSADLDGAYAVGVTATDAAGNQTSANFNFTWLTTAPVVSASSPVNTNGAYVSLSATAIGSGPLTYNWTTYAGAVPLTFLSNGTLTPVVMIPADGRYTARLTVTDAVGHQATADVVITLDSTAPVVAAGADQIASGPVALLATAQDANAMAYTWSQVSGPGIITFAAPNSLATNVSANGPGVYVLKFTARDAFGNSGSSTLTYNYDNIAPTVVLTSSAGSTTASSPIPLAVTFSEPVSGLTLDSFVLTGATASDLNGTGASYTINLQATGPSVITAKLNARAVKDLAGNDSVASAVFSIGYTGGGNGSGTGGGGIGSINGGISTTVTFQESDFVSCMKDHSTSAPSLPNPVDGSIPTFLSKVQFLLPNQSGLTIDISPEKIAVIRGRVQYFDGTPVIGAIVSVANYPGYGTTTTTACGDFSFAVDGGQSYTVVVHHANLIDGQRIALAPLNDFVWIDDLIMRPIDTKKTVVALGGSGPGMAVAQGSPMVDADGTRQATILIPKSSTVVVRNPDGTVANSGLTSITVSASEFTVGPNGPAAMPGRLPPNSKYTYAVALKIDEAAEGQTVEFSSTLHSYVDNFLKFPVGTIIPSGYYDQKDHYWKGSDDGIVIQILNVVDGKAVLGVTNTAVPATPDQLNTLEVTQDELITLASTFAVGKQLWRVPVKHFTSYDFNLSTRSVPSHPIVSDSRDDARNNPRSDDVGTPATPPSGPDCPANTCCRSPAPSPDPTTRTVNQSVEVSGTPFALNYQSDRMPGFKKSYELSIPVGSLRADTTSNGHKIDTFVVGVDVQVEVEGNRYKKSFVGTPYNDDVYTFRWDGKDQFGRQVLGGAEAKVTTTQHVIAPAYQTNYAWTMPTFGLQSSWATSGGEDSGISRLSTTTQKTASWQATVGSVGLLDPSRFKMGGWWLSAVNFKDIKSNIIYFGDGTARQGFRNNMVMTKLFGYTQYYSRNRLPIDFKYPISTGRARSSGIAVGADNSIYTLVIFDSDTQLVKLSPNGDQTIIAGNGNNGEIGGENVQALSTSLGTCSASTNQIKVATDGSVYFTECKFVASQSEWTVVRKYDPLTGLVKSVAGYAGAQGINPLTTSLQDGDGGPATEALIPGPVNSIALDNVGNLYIATASTIRKVTANGVIATIAGMGTFSDPLDNGDTGPALKAPMAPVGLAVTKDGSVYLADSKFGMIRRITVDGNIDAVVGTFPNDSQCISSTDPLDASEACNPQILGEVAVDKNDVVYFYDTFMIRHITANNVLVADIGSNGAAVSQVGAPNLASAPQFQLLTSVFALDQDGNMVIPDPEQNIWRSQMALGDVSSDGSQSYLFDASGLHLKTIDILTGKALYTFGYTAGFLTSITDINGQVTSIERNAGTGMATAIIGPFGERTQLTIDNASGLLTSIKQANQATANITYQTDASGAANGMMSSYQDFNGNTSRYEFDEHGLYKSSTDALGNASGIVEHPEMRTGSNDLVLVHNTPLGRTTTYKTQGLPGGILVTSVTNPDRSTVSLVSADTYTSRSDFQFSEVDRYSDDPVLGGYGRYASSVVIDTTPFSGTRFKVARKKTAIFANPQDSLSVTLLTDSTQINDDDNQTFVTTTDRVAKTVTSRTPLGYTSTLNYDENGRVTKVSAPGVYPTYFAYDALGRVIQQSQGSNCDTAPNATCHSTLLSYIPAGSPGAGSVATMTDPSGGVLSYTRDAVGRITSSTYGGVTTGLNYNNQSEITSVLTPGQSQLHQHDFAYTPVGLLQAYTPPAVAGLTSSATQYTYDADKGLKSVSLPDASGPLPITYSYNAANGQLTSEQRPEGLISYGYDNSWTYLNSIAGPGNVALSYEKVGSLLKTETYSNVPTAGVTLVARWTYNNLFKVASSGVDGGNTFAYTYDNDGALNKAGSMAFVRGANGLIASDSLGGTTGQYGYTSYGEMNHMAVNVGASALFDIAVTRDSLGRISTRTETVNGVDTNSFYQYNKLNRLASVTVGGQTKSYAYDVNGNRLDNNSSYDAQDRLISDNLFNYSYDARGAMRQKVSKLTGEISNYQYDVFGHLMSATLPGGNSVNYQLDGLGRRVARQANGGTWIGFIYQSNTQVIATVDSTGAVTEQFVYGTSGSSPDFLIKNGVTYRFVSDELGSIRLVVNAADGTIAQRLDYDVWGNVVADSAPGFQPFGFAGGLYDSVTGFTHFGARDLDPTTGRWTSRDPILFKGGQTNLYVYVGNDPINGIDPSGLNVYVVNTPAVGGFHQKIVVDTPNGQYGQSFGVGNPNAPFQSLASGVMPGPGLPGSGIVYQDSDPTTKIQRTFITTPAEDLKILNILKKQIGNTGPYNPVTNSCRDYSNGQFDSIVNTITQARQH